VRGDAGIRSALRALSPQPAALRASTFPLQGKVASSIFRSLFHCPLPSLGRIKEKGTAVRKRSEPDPKSQKYRDRFYAAQELVVRAYFEFWRACRYRPCRRARGCRGDVIDCIVARRAGESHRFDAARAYVRARIPKDAGAPERHAWMSDSCTVTWAKSPRKTKS
jgi:hypothetical protein